MKLTIETTLESDDVEALLKFLSSLSLPSHAITDLLCNGHHRMLAPIKGCGVMKTAVTLLKEPETVELKR